MIDWAAIPFPVFVRSIEDGIATFDANRRRRAGYPNFEITLVEGCRLTC